MLNLKQLKYTKYREHTALDEINLTDTLMLYRH